ncbi:protein Wiz isoform X4 [Canis lupus baileyi]|uniref:protein Wiz isoform X3 n=1 Tax=Canis lupus familiaris TaxID=9615 RepID=UPI0002747B9C|nr:protein Wiz isoform X3 [Canis lupus familiaris]XP_038311160.1 protein Wiz isoform X3 [Canis lupus familiaris]XP_038422940.1 protein Wiz isoform X3 [Canis lupus familiaris]|eukprot:XP_022262653.1 protein Wiz isoform X4 [Canis lupus familiaris]
MDGPLAGGLAAPDRPRGPERLPGPAPREDIEGGAEAAEGEGGIFRSTHYLPVTKEGPRDILDGRGGISDGQPHPGLSEALPRATSATHRISSCCWDGGSLDFQPGSPPPHLLGHFPGPPDGQGSWEHPLVQEAREGIPPERRFEDSVIVRTVKPHIELEGSRRFLHHQGEAKLLEKAPRGHPRFDWLQDTDEPAPPQDAGLHLDLPPQPLPLTSFRTVLVPVEDTTKTLDVTVVDTTEHLADLEELAQPSEWGLPRSASEVATQTWTVNSEASVERLQPLPSPIRTGPYLCELLEEVAKGVASPDEDEDEEPAVFPCIECSIYFKQKEHLLEHMSQHRRAPGQEPPADLAPLACGECGWAFADPSALEQHRQLHQASREKIIEEIQKLKQVPGDEGREARLQCPKCVFGTNSSKAFVQHAKLHVRELPGQPAREPFGGGSGADSPGPDATTLTYRPYRTSSGLSGCVFCGFPAPSESLLREHMRLAHAHPHWEEDAEAFEEDPASQPGTSQDAYARFPDAAEDYFGKAEALLAPTWQENPAGYDPSLAFGPGCQQLGVRDFPLSKPLLHGSDPRPPGRPAFPSPLASAPYSLQPSRNKSMVHLQGLPAQLGDRRHPWSEEEEEDIPLVSEMDFSPENGVFPPLAAPGLIPQLALDLKRTFRKALRAAEASRAQQQQLRGMVPLVLLAKLGPQVMAAATRMPPRLQPEELGLGGAHPLDFLLLDAPLGGPLGLDVLLDGDPAVALKHEERKCPYCPDRFHNGIGLANHVRGHLNRVGVSYNVRHFISAEEVKAIERRFSFQKKKKKVANFDPGTFSLMRCDFCGAGFDTRAGLSSHARAHLRDFGITNWELTVSPINILQELLATSAAERPPSPLGCEPGGSPSGFLTSRRPRLPLAVPFPPTWAEDPGPAYGDAQSLTTCEVCGACFETRKGLSSHARSHLRQLGVAESESSGAPIDLLYELVKQKGLPDTPLGLPPGLSKKSNSPKEVVAGAPRPGLLALAKPLDAPAVNKAIKSPPGFSTKGLAHPPSSPLLKKAPLALAGSPTPKNPEDKSPQLSLSPRPASPKAQWPQSEDEGPLNLTSGPEPARDIRCEFCGEFFENRKGLSSHARSHLRQMGVTEWYVNGSPIDTLREILKRRTQSRPGGPPNPPGPSPKALAKVVGSGGPGSSLEARSPADLHLSPLAKKLPPPPGSPLGHSPTASPPPTARKMFPGLAAPSLPKKLKPEQMRVEIKREMLPGALHGEPHPSEGPWVAPREDMAPLNLSSRAEPVRDIRCEFCGEFFENRKGLSSHARSHLRQMGVTEWSVNGSPIDTLREILKKKSKPCLIKKEPPAGDLAPALAEDGPPTAAPGPVQAPLPLVPMAGRPGKPGAGPAQVPRELSLAPITGAKPTATGYLGSVAAKRPLQEDRLLPAEVKAKTYIQTELPFKAKTLHEKTSHSSTEACCELCGLYFENRKALASHARAHLRQFGVTEWCVNGSPIETLSEWIKHRPQKVGAYRSYIQGGRPFTKKFRSAGHGRDSDKRPPLGLAPGGLAVVGRSAGGEPGPEAGRAADSGERPLAASPPGTVKAEEHQRQNINKFERRQARPPDASAVRGGEEANDLQQKLEEVRQPPPRVRPVPSLVPRPPQTSLVKFVGNIYTLKCRFCEVEFQGPLSIQEEWVRHLQRHILEMNFSKADPPPEEPRAPQAQTAAAEAP